MNTLVIGGTGLVGSAVVRELLARKAQVHVLTRDQRKAGLLSSGAHAVMGDLLDPATIRSVFRGRDAVFLLNGLSVSEAHEGLMAVTGAADARVTRLVYLSVQDVDRFPHLPHFGAKIGIEAAVRATNTAWTILRPNNFYQNDYRMKIPLVEHGIYGFPIGSAGLSRVDVRDVAEAAAIALTTGAHGGRTYVVSGPDVWTGDSTARAWSEALGRPVVYGGDDLDRWEEMQRAFVPPWMAFDFARMFGEFQAHGLVASSSDLSELTALLGHPPRSFRDFARELAGQWKGVA
jgi:uncharacterized protein YbjT (DUF2867 family)